MGVRLNGTKRQIRVGFEVGWKCDFPLKRSMQLLAPLKVGFFV